MEEKLKEEEKKDRKIVLLSNGILIKKIKRKEKKTGRRRKEKTRRRKEKTRRRG